MIPSISTVANFDYLTDCISPQFPIYCLSPSPAPYRLSLIVAHLPYQPFVLPDPTHYIPDAQTEQQRSLTLLDQQQRFRLPRRH